MLLCWHLMKSDLILMFKMNKKTETGLQLLQTGIVPLISMKSRIFSRTQLGLQWSWSIPYVFCSLFALQLKSRGFLNISSFRKHWVCGWEVFLVFWGEILSNGFIFALGYFMPLLLAPCYLAYSLPWQCFFCAAVGFVLLSSCCSLEDDTWQFTAWCLIVSAILSSRWWLEH